MRLRFVTLFFALLACPLSAGASGNGKYEVWAIDQSNSPGKAYGGTLYVWDGHALENRAAIRVVK